MEALYAMGQIEELVDDCEGAEANYREAISIIETTRSEIQLSALRVEFLADSETPMTFDQAATYKMMQKRPSSCGAKPCPELSGSPRLAQVSGTAPIPEAPALMRSASNLDPSSILLEYWVSASPCFDWCTRESYGIQQAELLLLKKDRYSVFSVDCRRFGTIGTKNRRSDA